ncbi:very short patch repair endonuclease [Bifidobacterium fermentum]|uniref:Very short patch repair endonuclease n=1 Tax=Bifidobacterium fermentum TaxID=3059035 RepID=A0AB39UJF1_9BIFI
MTNKDSTESQGKFPRGSRSYIMSRIRGRDTKPEILVRRYLFSRGLRFRKNDPRYPGKPDVILPKYHVAIFVNGCFWHRHEGCRHATVPKTNVEFWTAKFLRNRARDAREEEELTTLGWHVIVVWECELTKSERAERLSRLYEEVTGESGTESDGESAPSPVGQAPFTIEHRSTLSKRLGDFSSSESLQTSHR